MNDDNSLDLLDLDDNGAMDTLPEATPFAAPRPKKPWLLLGVGLVVIVLATYVIIRAIGDDSASSIEVDLDAPVVMDAGMGADMNVMPPVQPVQAQPQPQPEQVKPAPKPVAQPQPQPVLPFFLRQTLSAITPTTTSAESAIIIISIGFIVTPFDAHLPRLVRGRYAPN